MAFVYVHFEADTGNPFYVGMGDKKRRPWQMNHHSRTEFHRNIVKKHGVVVKVIADNLSWEQANAWEMHWIKALRSSGYRLVNLTDGGDGTKGIPAHNRKSVLCLETGELFKSAIAAGEAFSLSGVTISDCCRGKYGHANFYHFIYSASSITEEERKLMIKNIDIKFAQKRKRVLINDQPNRGIVNGKDVKGRSAAGPAKSARKVYSVTDDIAFPSASEASRHYNIARSAIIELCLGKNGRRTAGGIIFKYVEEM